MVRAGSGDEAREEAACGAEEGGFGEGEVRDDAEVEFGGEAEERWWFCLWLLSS